MNMKRFLTLAMSANLTAAALMAGCSAPRQAASPYAEASTAAAPATQEPTPSPEPPSVTLKFDASSPGAPIPDLASDLIMWDYHSDWLDTAESFPDDHFQKEMPFVRYVQFIAATGGETARDLFKDPNNRAVLDDYDFSSLVRACGNVLKKGLKPYISTGNVPLKLSSRPAIGGFSVNTMPPDDYEQYYKYITALLQALKDQFGAPELLTWKWGVLTEYENADWFSIKDDPKATEEAYFKLYDYTVDALQNVVGDEVVVGAHSMSVIEGMWDEREFVDHCAKGKNYKTGKTGTRLCFLTSSYYDYTPADRAGDGLARTVDILQNRAAIDNLTGIRFGVDEGRILSGTDDKALFPRAIGQTMQASSDARLFKIMLDHDIGYFASWGYTSNGIWEGAPSVSLHTVNLFYGMVGERRVKLVNREGLPAFESNDVNGFAGADPSGRRVSVMAYAYTNDMGFTGSERVRVRVDGAAGLGARATVTKYVVDDDANWFDEWIRDRQARGIADDSFDWSRDSFVLTNPAVLKSDGDRLFFISQLDRYRKCSELRSTEQVLDVVDGAVTVDLTIPHHAVVFLDMTPAG